MSEKINNSFQKNSDTTLKFKQVSNLCALLCFFLLGTYCYSQEKIIKLKKDSFIQVGQLKVPFKGGTEIKLKSNNTLISGVLANNIDLISPDKRKLPLKIGSIVEFTDQGYVIGGTLRKSDFKICFRMPKYSSHCLDVINESKFSLNEDGTIYQGVLKYNEVFATYPYGIMITFASNGQVTLRKNGTIQSGFLFNDLKHQSLGLFKSGCFIEFDEKGNILKGVRNNKGLNGKILLQHIEIINGKPENVKNKHSCICAF